MGERFPTVFYVVMIIEHNGKSYSLDDLRNNREFIVALNKIFCCVCMELFDSLPKDMREAINNDGNLNLAVNSKAIQAYEDLDLIKHALDYMHENSLAPR